MTTSLIADFVDFSFFEGAIANGYLCGEVGGGRWSLVVVAAVETKQSGPGRDRTNIVTALTWQ